jgi:hypothetical protein
MMMIMRMMMPLVPFSLLMVVVVLDHDDSDVVVALR